MGGSEKCLSMRGGAWLSNWEVSDLGSASPILPRGSSWGQTQVCAPCHKYLL